MVGGSGVARCGVVCRRGGDRVTGLIRKATGLTRESERLTYCVCAREEIINADADTLTVTAADIFG